MMMPMTTGTMQHAPGAPMLLPPPPPPPSAMARQQQQPSRRGATPSCDPVYAVWRRVRGPFRLPAGCHRCEMADWEVFDVDKAGCVHCGRLHQCVDGGDCVGAMDHDHQACEITGCWIRSRNFQQSYADLAAVAHSSSSSSYCGAANRSSAPPPGEGEQRDAFRPAGPAHPPGGPRPWVDSTLVVRWLHTLVRSDAARRCISRETQRVMDKATVAFARVAKSFKLEGRRPCILDMLSHTRFMLGSLRIPCKVAGQDSFDELASHCVAAIMRFTSGFRKVLAPHVPPAKLDHFVIGLIYLLRSGIVMFDTLQVVPRIPALRRLLPMETSLKLHFRIPCKIITEVENITKITLKALDRRAVRQMMGE